MQPEGEPPIHLHKDPERSLVLGRAELIVLTVLNLLLVHGADQGSANIGRSYLKPLKGRV